MKLIRLIIVSFIMFGPIKNAICEEQIFRGGIIIPFGKEIEIRSSIETNDFESWTVNWKDQLFMYSTSDMIWGRVIKEVNEICWLKVQHGNKTGWIKDDDVSYGKSIIQGRGNVYTLVKIALSEAGSYFAAAAIASDSQNYFREIKNFEYGYGQWSRNGKLFLYQASVPDKTYQIQWNANIPPTKVYLFSMASKTIKLLTSGLSPIFTHNNKEIIFLKEFDNNLKKTKPSVCKIGVDGNNYKELLSFPENYDFWGEIIDIASPSKIVIKMDGDKPSYKFHVYQRLINAKDGWPPEKYLHFEYTIDQEGNIISKYQEY